MGFGHLFYQKYSKNSDIVKYDFILLSLFLRYKANFSASLLQSSVSYDPSEKKNGKKHYAA